MFSWQKTWGAKAIWLNNDASLGAAVSGDANANTLRGDADNDWLAGGLGNDELWGGCGSDTFRFDTKPHSATKRDWIMDFNVVDDTIELENAIFGSLATAGTLASGSFVSGRGATSRAFDTDDFVIYDSGCGALYYDADATGAGGAVQFANISAGLTLSPLDFMVT